MKQFKTVFSFELNGLLKNKSLRITTLIMVVLSVLLTTIPTLMAWFQDEPSTQDEPQESIALVYETAELEQLMSPTFGDATYASEAELVEAVEAEEVEYGVVIQDESSYKAIAYDRLNEPIEQQVFEEQLLAYQAENLFQEENIDSERVYAILNQPLNKEEVFLGKDSSSGIAFGFFVILVVYLLVLLYGGNVANSVAREKDSRTMELLITSTKPRTLILGKVAAAGLTGILQVSLLIGSTMIGFLLNKSNYPEFLLEMVKGSMTFDTIGIYLLFSILGYILYLFIFASLGSLVSKVEDVSKSIAPITFLFFVAYMAAIGAMSMPSHPLIKVSSFIPFFSLLTMPIRYMLTSVSLVSIGVSSLIMILTVFLFATISIYIYRYGALNYGNRLSIKKILKSFKRT